MNEDLSRILLIAGVGLVLYYLYRQYTSGQTIKNSGSVSVNPTVPVTSSVSSSNPTVKKMIHPQVDESAATPSRHEIDYNQNVVPFPQMSNNFAPQNNYNQDHLQGLACFPKDELRAEDLIPREDVHNAWTETNPQGPGVLSDKNFLESGHHFWINTVGQSLKNPNLQIRSDPAIPQVAVGPWQQSTTEPDTNRLPLEIGRP